MATQLKIKLSSNLPGTHNDSNCRIVHFHGKVPSSMKAALT